jgi:hypothetical protein
VDGPSAGLLCKQRFGLPHHVGHAGAYEFQAAFHSHFPPLLLVQRPHFGALGIVKKGKGQRSGDVGLGKFTR